MRQWKFIGLLAGIAVLAVVVGCELEGGGPLDDEFADTGTTDTGNTTDTGGEVPPERCIADGVCEPGCGGADPDCGVCSCDRQVGRCDAGAPNSTARCDCDPDCAGAGAFACGTDGSCDTYCPSGSDPDCAPPPPAECACDYYRNVCEARSRGSSDVCACDPDCAGGRSACSDDGHCDTFCPDGVDPDCSTEPTCSCDYNPGICEAARRNSNETCGCDPDCEGTAPCKADGHCDTWCPEGEDPDCD